MKEAEHKTKVGKVGSSVKTSPWGGVLGQVGELGSWELGAGEERA